MTKITMQTTGGNHRPGLTPGVDRRFNERDINVYPELRPLAIEYTRNYTGSFDPLLAAQELLHETGTLPDSIVKLVLNTAYSDPSVRFKLDLGNPDARQDGDNVVPLREHQPRYIHTPEPEPEPKVRRWRLRTKVKINKPYGMSRFNGKVLHRVSPYGAYMEWPWKDPEGMYHADRDPTDRDERGVPSLHLKWVCGGGFPTNPTLLDKRPNLRGEPIPYCRGGCFSWSCPCCGKAVHLDPDAEPEDPIGACPRCGEPEPRGHRAGVRP